MYACLLVYLKSIHLVALELPALERLPFTFDQPHTTIHRERGISPHLSPYTLCRFLLGLPPGVISRCLPASSDSFMGALLSAFGSTESAPVPLLLLATFSSLDFISDFRFSVAGGGVIERGGVATGGVFKEFEAFVMCAYEMAEFVISLLGAMMAIRCRKRGWLSEYCPASQ
jgi:hypothetical protein